MNNNDKILVTGASVKLGHLVIEALLKDNRKNLIGTTRTPEKVQALANKGVVPIGTLHTTERSSYCFQWCSRPSSN